MKKSIFITHFIFASLFARGVFAQSADSLITTIIKVGNLHCNNDMPTIKKQLQNQEGVEEISFTERAGDKSTFTISYHSSATSQQQIELAIESTPGCDDKKSTPYKVIRKSLHKNRKGS